MLNIDKDFKSREEVFDVKCCHIVLRTLS